MTQVTVANITTDVLAYQGKKVCTTRQLAAFYGAGEENIQKNYERNAERFVEGVHFVKLEGSDLRQFKAALPVYLSVSPNTRNLLLWTEKGAARHAKMLSTDKAWDVFEQLEETYFAISDLAKTIGYEGNIPALIEDISDAVMNRMGGMVKAIVHKQNEHVLHELLPGALDGLLAKQQLSVRKGVTAGQIIERYGFKRIKNLSSWLSGRLRKLNCHMAGKGELGSSSAWLFDPDRVDAQMKVGGLMAQTEAYISRRSGQMVLGFITKK